MRFERRDWVTGLVFFVGFGSGGRLWLTGFRGFFWINRIGGAPPEGGTTELGSVMARSHHSLGRRGLRGGEGWRGRALCVADVGLGVLPHGLWWGGGV